jgi:hypothetical protein
MPSDSDLLKELDAVLVRYARARLESLLDGQAPSILKQAPVKRSRGKFGADAPQSVKSTKVPSAKLKAANEAKRIAGTKPVACPAPGCKKPGVRRFRNFCSAHAESLGAAEKRKLRAAQKAAAAG